MESSAWPEAQLWHLVASLHDSASLLWASHGTKSAASWSLRHMALSSATRLLWAQCPGHMDLHARGWLNGPARLAARLLPRPGRSRGAWLSDGPLQRIFLVVHTGRTSEPRIRGQGPHSGMGLLIASVDGTPLSRLASAGAGCTPSRWACSCDPAGGARETIPGTGVSAVAWNGAAMRRCWNWAP
jgi:hypothetical protein